MTGQKDNGGFGIPAPRQDVRQPLIRTVASFSNGAESDATTSNRSMVCTRDLFLGYVRPFGSASPDPTASLYPVMLVSFGSVDVQSESMDGPYIAPHVTFRGRAIESS